MAGRATSLFLVSLMLGSLFSALPTTPSSSQQTTNLEPLENLFQGFNTGGN